MEKSISQQIEILNSKMDHIIASQNIILKHLQIPIVESLSDYIVIKPTEKYLDKNSLNYMLRLVLLNRKPIQEHFNLEREPQTKRVVIFLNTMDPKVFDGLKRKPKQH